MGKIIMGFDPGGSTGYCVAETDDSRLGFFVRRCNVVKWNDTLPVIRTLLGHFRPDICIVEEFILYKDKAKDMVGERMLSSEVKGAIRAYLYEYGLKDALCPFASAISRTEIPDEHLKYLPKLEPKMQEHARDAYKHVRHHIVVLRAAEARRKQTQGRT